MAFAICPCGSGLITEVLFDRDGIFCCYVCDECEDGKRDKFKARIAPAESEEE